MNLKSVLANKKLFYLFLLFPFLQIDFAVAQERAVAIVYDNSYSMRGGQCDAVNYALQAMIGVLSPDDELYVVTMEDEQLYNINLRDKQNEINNKIKPLQCRRDNPFGAVDIAVQQLNKSRKDRKFLLLLADGEWEDLDPKHRSPNIVAKNKATLASFANEANANILFLNLDQLEADPKNSLKNVLFDINRSEALQTEGKPKKIIQQMGDMAATVMSMPSEGIAVNATKNKVTLDSKVPLKRLIIVGQSAASDSQLPNIKSVRSGNNQLFVEGPFEAEKKSTNINLKGKILHVKANSTASKSIPEGRIEIELDKSISLSQFKFLPETAAELKIDFDGFFKTNAKDVLCDTVKSIILKAQILDLDGKPLNETILAESKVQFVNSFTQKSSDFTFDETKKVFTFRLSTIRPKFSFYVTARHPNYFNYKSIVYQLRKEECPVPKGFIEANTTNLKAKVTELSKAESIILTPQIKDQDGKTRPPTDAELADLDIELVDNGAGIKFHTKRQNGQLTLTPASAYFCTLCTQTGQQQLNARLISKTNKVDVSETEPLVITIEVEDVPFLQRYGFCLLLLLVGLFLLWYLFGLFKKQRFAAGSEIVVTKDGRTVKQRARSYPLPTGFVKRWLLPYITESQTVGSIAFKAGSRDGHIYLSADTQNENMYISGFPIEEAGKKDLRISHGETLEIVRRNHKEIYTYRNLE